MKQRHEQVLTVRDPGPVGEESPTDDEHDLRDLRILEALYHEWSLMAEEDPTPPTTDEQNGVEELGVFIEQLVRTPPGSRLR